MTVVFRRVPHPRGETDSPLRLLLFDAYHDDYRGVICLVEVVDGEVRLLLLAHHHPVPASLYSSLLPSLVIVLLIGHQGCRKIP